jgi:hypothetical protein
MKRYFKFACQLGTQYAIINDNICHLQTGFGWAKSSEPEDMMIVFSSYDEITEEEFLQRERTPLDNI